MLRGLIKVICCTLLLGLALSANAEVSVRTDRSGAYISTQIVYSARVAPDRVWSAQGRGRRTGNLLNPAGDANGDLWPTIAESPSAPYHPWVVWSRFDGAGYDLAWSRWTNSGWTPVTTVFNDRGLGDDLDADITFNEEDRPCIAWWRDEAGGGRVYISVFLNRMWSQPYPVSPADVDSRYPTIEAGPAGGLTVEYLTPDGMVSQLVLFHEPETITDDINPQTCFSLKGTPRYIGASNHR